MARAGAQPGSTERSKGFTLVELLVVITVVAVLVGITLPALSGSRETSRRLKCLTNLKGLGVGFAVYMNDSKDLLPRARPLHQLSNENDPSLLDTMIQYLDVPAPQRTDPNDLNSPFTNVSEVFRCPSDIVGRDQATNFRPVWQSDGFSYEYFAGELMWGFEQLTLPEPQAGVSKAYQQPQWKDLAVILDFDDWHPQRRGGIPRNALYFGDWRADWAAGVTKVDMQDPRLERLFCDISRFGGRPIPGCN